MLCQYVICCNGNCAASNRSDELVVLFHVLAAVRPVPRLTQPSAFHSASVLLSTILLIMATLTEQVTVFGTVHVPASLNTAYEALNEGR